MEQQKIKNIIEAVLMAAETPLKVTQIEALFAGDSDMPTRDEIRAALNQLVEDFENRGFELKQVASGFRIQVRQDYADWVGRLWEEKPARYTRALLETLALIAYRQPITRGEIEEVRGVSVSSNIIKTLMEREWIKVLGHKDVPGKPALYGTTREFLDYFNLKSLDELPTLAEIKDLDKIHQELDLDIDNTAPAEGGEDAAAADDATGADDEDDDLKGELAGAEEADAGQPEVEQAEAESEDAGAEEAASGDEAVEDEHAGDEYDDGSGVRALAAMVEQAGDQATRDEETAAREHDEDSKVKSVAAAVDDVEAEEEFTGAEPQSAAS
jgi:segregation and condensation protein B